VIAVVVVVLVAVFVVLARSRGRSARRTDAAQALSTVLLEREPYKGRRWKESERPWL
jgi:hypothetical protein